ncbi:hypothetical protein Cgig2_020895 [Carnegiea gigantea]|uniref:Uncharacterized protein n=1 Tax=Carnegiea gigantea TaxID=171969 RepID=A0A9Q1GM04_9CARY|nr:hypothetical protein Cgig2_020895 [Carnegiea gigantea]
MNLSPIPSALVVIGGHFIFIRQVELREPLCKGVAVVSASVAGAVDGAAVGVTVPCAWLSGGGYGFLQKVWHPADPTSEDDLADPASEDDLADPTFADDFFYRYYLSELTIDGNGKFLRLGDAGSDPYIYTTTTTAPSGGPAVVNSGSSDLNKKPCFTFSSSNDFGLMTVQFQHNASHAPVESSFRRPLDGDTFKAHLAWCHSFRADCHDRQELVPLFWTCILARDKVYCLFPARFRFPESQPAFWCHDPATEHDEILISLSNMEFYSYSIKLGIWRKVAFRPELNEKCKPPLAKTSYPVVGEAMCSYGDKFYVFKFDTLRRYTLKFGMESLELICSGVFCLPPNSKLAHVFASGTELQWIYPFSDNLLCIIGVKYNRGYDERASICFSTVFLLEDSFLIIPLDSAQEMGEAEISDMSCFIMDAEPRLYCSTLLHNIAQMTVQEMQSLPSPVNMEQKMKSLPSEMPPINRADKLDPVPMTTRMRPCESPWAVFYFDEVTGGRTLMHHLEKIREARYICCCLYALYRIDLGQDGCMLGSDNSFLQPIYVIDVDEKRRKQKTIVQFQCAVLDRKLYLVPFEYFRPHGSASFDTFVLDTSQMELSFESRMKTAKAHGLVMCASKKIYVLKDALADEVPNPLFESYDPRTDLWKELPRPPVVQKYSAEGYAVVDDRFIIISLAPLRCEKLHYGDFCASDTKMQSWSCVKKFSSYTYYDCFDGKAECVDRNILVILGGCAVAFKLVGEYPNFQLCAPVVLAANFLPKFLRGSFRCWSTCMTHLGDLRFCVLLAINDEDSDTADSLHAVTFQAFRDAYMGHLMFDPDSVMVSKRLFSLQGEDNALSFMHCFFVNESTLPLQSLCSGIDVEKLDTAQLRLQDIVSTSNRALGTAWTMHRFS